MDENKLPLPYDPVYDVSKIRPIDANALVRGIEEAQGRLRADGDRMWEHNKPYFKGLALANRLTRDAPTLTAEDILSKRGEPLTLEQLPERVWKPVWVEDLGSQSNSGWSILRTGCFEGKYLLYYWEDYGKKWLAYDYPPANQGLGTGINVPTMKSMEQLREAWEPCEECGVFQFEKDCLCCANCNIPQECEPCKSCNGDRFKPKYIFCPRCGRPRTDEAWAKLEKRLRG